MRRCWRREEVQESQGPRVPRSRGPKDQDITNSHSNTSLTLKKVHLVLHFKLHDNDIVEKRLQLKFLKVKGYSPQSKYRIACFS